MSKVNKFAFPDTNMFLHFRFFTEIAWNKILRANAITLVIPPIILRELDKHKHSHSSDRIKDRATKITKKLAEILRSDLEIRPKVIAHFERIEPQAEFEKYNLSKDSQDDHLIASILRFQNENGEKAILITDDMSLTVKAYQLNIEVFELPEEYRIKPEEAPYKKKIRELEKELFELRNRVPRLKLVSKDGNEEVTTETLSVDGFVEEHTENEIEDIKKKYPLITEILKLKRSVAPIVKGKPYRGAKVEFKSPSGEFKRATLGTIEKYNKDVKEFYEKYKNFLTEKAKIRKLRDRTIKLQLKLINEGTSPAERFHVVLKFPKDFQITTRASIFSHPEEISPPQLVIMADIFSGSFSTLEYTPNYASLFDAKLSKVKIPWEEVSIKSEDSVYTADFQNTKLSHGYSFDCPEVIYVSFPTNQTVESFQIGYKITADNLPKANEGKLNIIVNKNKSSIQ